MPGPYYHLTVQEYLTWPPANYIDPPEYQWLGPYAIVLLVLATLCVGGRLYLRSRKGRPPWDDYLILIAWIFGVAFTVTACLGQWKLYFGRNSWNIPINLWADGLFNGWLAQVFFAHSLSATKMAILGFYVRMFHGTTKRRWLVTVWVLMAVTFISWIAFFVAYCTYCFPLSDVWNWPLVQLQKGNSSFNCIDSSGLIIGVGTFTVASDFWCAALPFLYFQYNNIGTTRKQTIAMNIIFCQGFLVTGIGAARTYYLWQLAHMPDPSYWGYKLFAVALAECHLSIILACAPFLRAFFRRFLPDKKASALSPDSLERHPLSNVSASDSRRSAAPTMTSRGVSRPTTGFFDDAETVVGPGSPTSGKHSEKHVHEHVQAWDPAAEPHAR